MELLSDEEMWISAKSTSSQVVNKYENDVHVEI